MPTPSVQGRMSSATLRFGTGVAETGDAASYNVRSVSRRARAQTIPILDSEGFTDTIVTINDGDDLDIVCIDDTSITPPEVGDVMSLRVPGWSEARDVLITAVSQSVTQSAAGEISFSAQYFVNVTLA